MKKNLVLGGVILAASVFVACDKNDDEGNVVILPSTSQLSLDLPGLENLGPDYVYEGWIMVNGSPITAGRFSVDDSGMLSSSSFTIPKDKADLATAYILTIEPALNDDPAPSDVHLVAGNFANKSASLSVNHPAALNNSFMSATGKYMLATPTDGGMMDNEKAGVWFIDNSTGMMAPGLNLPTLPAGWVYEGWVVNNGVPLSTGTFTSASMADNSAIYSGTVAGPAFPGEDFLRNAPTGMTFPLDLSGKTVVVSIEPFPDNSDHPFLLKPLSAGVSMNPTVHTPYAMTNNLASFPTGTVSLQ